MKKFKFILKGTSIFWLPIVAGYIANALSDILINLFIVERGEEYDVYNRNAFRNSNGNVYCITFINKCYKSI